MPVVTVGTAAVAATPMVLTSGASLQDIKAAIDASLYAPSGEPTIGWGSSQQGDDLVGSGGRGLLTGIECEILPAEGDFRPERLLARLFWDEPDGASLKYATQGNIIYRFQAADVLISKTTDKDVFDVLVSVRSRKQVNTYVLPALRSMAEELSPSGTVSADRTTRGLPSEDMYRWLIAKMANDPQVSGDIQLRSVRSVSAEDTSSRTAKISDGVMLDRAELLALIGANSTNLGPAKMLVTDSVLDLDVDLELRLDGGFSIYTAASDYGAYASRGERAIRREFGLRSWQDLAFKILPAMCASYNADSQWAPGGGRDAFVDTCRMTLATLLLPQGCPHCGTQIDTKDGS